MAKNKKDSDILSGELEQPVRTLTAAEMERYREKYLSSKYIDVRSDWGFKHLMRVKELLMMLVGDVLNEKIVSVEHLPNEVDRFLGHEKDVTMDVLCKDSQGRELIVEMQRKEESYFRNRMVYYGASMIHAQLASGVDYDEMRPVVVICIMDYKEEHIPEARQDVFCYSLMERTTHELFGNQLTIYLCELPRKQHKSMSEMNYLEIWLYLLKNMHTFAEVPEDLPSRFLPVLDAAETKGLDPQEMSEYITSMLSQSRIDASIRAAFDRGEAKGVAQGRAEGLNKAKEQFTKHLQEAGFAPELIEKLTSL